jgi:hypothetical protein
MGTGFVATTKLSPDGKTVLPAGPVILSGPLSQPDLLTDHNSSLVMEFLCLASHLFVVAYMDKILLDYFCSKKAN